MELKNKDNHPKEGKLVFILNNQRNLGFVGLGMFKNGNWYMLPTNDLINNVDFDWIDSIDQPERSKREDSQKCEMRCSEHCGNTVRDK